MKTVKLPRHTSGDLVDTFNNAMAQIERILSGSPAYSTSTRGLSVVPSGSRAYAASNITTTRSLNASTAAVADVANVLGTLIADLKSGGSIA